MMRKTLEVIAAALVLSTLSIFPALAGAFVYKVWNERQMTLAYREQAQAQRRMADALERIAAE